MAEKQISKQFTTSLADQNPNPVLRVSPAGLILYANKASEILLDFFQTATGNTLPDFWINMVKEAFASGKRKDTEVNTGTVIYTISIMPLEKEGCVHIYCNDITERKKAEQKLQESETKYRNLVEAANDFIYSADHLGNFTYINPVGLKKIGYTSEEIIGVNFTYLIREDWKQVVADFYKDQFQKKIINTYFEFPIVAKNGQDWWVGQNVQMILENDWITGFRAYARDVTERKKAEVELIKQQQLINSILDQLPINIFLKDREGKYLFVNKHALVDAKINRADILGKGAYDFYPYEFAESITNSDEEAWRNKIYITEEHIVVDGTMNHLIVGKSIINFENFEEPLLLGYSVDITERKKAEQELLKAKQKLEESIIAKEKFISIMSHEIRTPMNAVVGITNLLLQEEHNYQNKEYYNALKISSESLLNILNNVLNLSKIESGKVLFEEIDFNILETLTKVKELFAFRAAEKNITLNIHIDPKIPEYIKGDPSRLDQILVNLMSNAIKFTDEGSVGIKVELLDENKDTAHLLFSVSDTGIGIPKEMLGTVFESFTQANTDISRKYGGTGLGLTITKHLIELQGGNIDVESVLNKGSKFIFDLKFFRTRNSEQDNLNKKVKNNSFNLSGLKALVVEDNKMNQLVVSKFLQRENITVDIAENGIKALDLLKKNKYDIVLMDLQMPEMDGYEATEHIRNKMKMKALPIIAFTASSSFDIENKVIEAGMNDYIVKPFVPSVFYSTIAKYTAGKTGKNNSKMKPQSQSKNIDLSYLTDAAGGNRQFIKEMIEIFLKQTPVYIVELKKFCKEENWDEFRKIMHKIKPTITMMGIKEGDGYVKEIDYRVKNKTEIEKISSFVEKMETLFDRTYVELKEELKL